MHVKKLEVICKYTVLAKFFLEFSLKFMLHCIHRVAYSVIF